MADTHLQFHIATPEDAPAIQQLVQAAFQAADTRQDWTADMELNVRFRLAVEEVLSRITASDSEIIMAFTTTTTAPEIESGKQALVASIEVVKRSIY